MSINFSVRWADNTDALKRNLAEGLDQIEVTRAAVDKLTKSLSGENQIRAANNWAASIQKLGGEAGALAGVQKLTTAELERGNAALDRAISKYQLMGTAVPTSIAQLKDLVAAQIAASASADTAAKSFDRLVVGLSASGKSSADAAKWMASISPAAADAAAKVTALNKPLDAMASGLSAAGKQASASTTLINGMSAAGALAASKLAVVGTESEKAGQSVGVFGSAFSHLAASITSGLLLHDAIHAVVGEIKDMIHVLPELALRGASVADVEENFKRLNTQAGRLGDTLLGTLRAGTHNTITDFELMKTANQDLAAGMALTDKQFGTLAKGAFALAQATGGDVKTGLDTMNDAMLTGRTRSLALLVGKLNLTKAEEDFAKGLLSTAEHLTEEGKLEAARVAILNAVGAATERLGEQMDGLDERVAQASTALENFKENLGKTIATSVVLEAGMSSLKDSITETFGPRQDALIQAIAASVDDAAIALASIAKAGVYAGAAIAHEWFALQKTFRESMIVVEGTAIAFDYASLAVLKFRAATAYTNSEQQHYAETIKVVEANIVSLKNSLAEQSKAWIDADNSQLGIQDTTKKYLKILDDLRVAMEAAKKNATAFVGPLQEGAKVQDAAAAAAARLGAMLQVSKKELSDATAAQKKYTDAVERYNSTEGADYLSIIDKIGNAMYEGIAFDKKRGKSTEDLIQIYKTTSTVIEQVVKSEDAYAKKLDAVTAAAKRAADIEKEIAAIIKAQTVAVNAATVKGLDDRLKAQQGYDTEVARMTLSAVDFQKAEIEVQIRNQKALGANLVGNAKETSDLVVATLELRLSQIDTLWKEHPMFPPKLKDETKNNIDEIGASVERLGRQISGSMGNSVFAIGSFIREFKKASTEAGKVAAAIEGGLAVGTAVTAEGSRGNETFKGAQAGAAIGTAIFPGYGTAIGAGVGAIAGALKVPGDEKAARQQLIDFKKQLADLFDSTASMQLKATVGADSWAKMVEEVKAAYIATGHTVEDALNDINTASDHTRNNVELLPDDLEKINKILKQTLNFGPEAQASASAVGLIDKSFLDLLNHAKELGGVTQSMKDFVAAQGSSAETGLGAALQIGNDALKKRSDLQSQIADLTKQQQAQVGSQEEARIKAGNDAYAKRLDIQIQIKQLTQQQQGQTGSEADDTAKKIVDLSKQLVLQGQLYDATQNQAGAANTAANETAQKILELNQQLIVQSNLYDATGIHSQAAADAVSGGLLAIINDQILAGKSFHDSVMTVAPAVDALSAQMIDAGLSGSTAFDQLRAQVALVKDEVAGPALTAVEGYAQGLVGLNNAGLLNQDMFRGLTGQINIAHDALIAQGQDGVAVLSAMRGPLQTIWELQTKFGYTTDDSTQALIDQAKEQGLVGEKYKPIGEQMLDATNKIADAIKRVADALAPLPKNAVDAAKGMQDALNNIHPNAINVRVNFARGDSVSAPDGTDINPPGFASGSGGLRDFGSGTLAMLHGREAVLTAAELADASGGSRGAVFEAMLAQFRTTQQTTDRLARYLIQDQATVIAKAMRDEVGKVRTHA